MKAGLQLSMGQQLTLTPQLQQAIRLLQLSTLDLSQEINQAVEANPLLELDENTPEEPHEQPQKSSLTDSYSGSASSSSQPRDDNRSDENLFPTTTDLREHLLWQMELSPMSKIDAIIGTALIDAIDDDGFLQCSVEEIQQSLNNDDYEFECDEIEAVLHRIQLFDPIGCGSRDLSECLAIQLKQLSKDTPHLSTTQDIVLNALDLLGTHHYNQLLKQYKIDETILQEIIQLIQSLNPRPGAYINPSKTEYVIPDVLVNKIEGKWQVTLNPEALPKIKINTLYSNMVQSSTNKQENRFIREHLQEARWFIKSIQSRQETLLKVANAIVSYQEAFLEQGAEAMKPLVLHDIAETIEMHESTISRVTTQKYMHTPRGIFELKYFFSSHVNTNSGGECSSTAIRAVIKKLIAAENSQKPLSDNKMAKILAEQGIKVARRTIAKYRESMGIRPSHERKSFAKK